MIRVHTRVLLAFLPLSLCCEAATLSLDEALAIALSNNTAVSNARLRYEATEDDIAALKAARFPRLDLSGKISHSLEDQDYTFDQGVWGDYPVIGEVPDRNITIESSSGINRTVSVGVTQPLAQQYQLSLSIEQGEVKGDMASEYVRLTRQDVARLVKQQYFEILQTQSTLVATRESIVFYTSLVELVTNYVEQKMAFDYELLETEARLARRMLDESAQKNRLNTQKERLNSMLARNINTPFDIEALPAEVLPDGPLDDAVATALLQRPEIRESQLKIKAAKLGYKIKKAEYLPAVDLNVRYIRLYDTSLIPDTEAYIGLQARWEIYDWGRKKNELAGESSLIQQATNSAREVENRVTIDVRRSYRSIAEAQEEVAVAELSQAAARDKLRVLTNQYEQQSTLLQNVLDAVSDLDKANNVYNRAILSVWKAQAELQRAVGEL